MLVRLSLLTLLLVGVSACLDADASFKNFRRNNSGYGPNKVFQSNFGGGSLVGGNGETLTLARASAKYCPNLSNGTISILANNAPCMASGFVLIEGATTNLILRSDEVGAAAQWLLFNASIAANVATTPWGTATMDRVTSNTTGNGNAYQGVTVSSSTGPFTASAWGAATSGTHSATLNVACFGTTPATCTCKRDDGTTCTASTNGADCMGDSSFTTTPQRVQVTATCNAAVTTLYIGLGGGVFSGATNQSHDWGGAQFEVRRYATTYVPTDATAGGKARVGDVLTVPTNPGWPTTNGAMYAQLIPMWGSAVGPNNDNAIMGNPNGATPTYNWQNTIATTGKMNSDMRKNGAASQILSSSAQTWTHKTTYALRYTWATDGTIFFWKDGVSVAPASAAHASSAMPDQIKNPVAIGSNFNGYVDAWVGSICVSTSTNGCNL